MDVWKRLNSGTSRSRGAEAVVLIRFLSSRLQASVSIGLGPRVAPSRPNRCPSISATRWRTFAPWLQRSLRAGARRSSCHGLLVSRVGGSQIAHATTGPWVEKRRRLWSRPCSERRPGGHGTVGAVTPSRSTPSARLLLLLQVRGDGANDAAAALSSERRKPGRVLLQQARGIIVDGLFLWLLHRTQTSNGCVPSSAPAGKAAPATTGGPCLAYRPGPLADYWTAARVQPSAASGRTVSQPMPTGQPGKSKEPPRVHSWRLLRVDARAAYPMVLTFGAGPKAMRVTSNRLPLCAVGLMVTAPRASLMMVRFVSTLSAAHTWRSAPRLPA